MKKLQKIFLSLCIPAFFVGGVISTQAQTFSDIPENSQYYNAAEYLADEEIINPDNENFRPNDPINRAEFTKIVLLCEYSQSEIESIRLQDTLDDVMNINDWFFYYINFAWSKGIVNGYPGGMFKPAKLITKGESAKVLVNTLLDGKNKDISEENWCGGWWCGYVEEIRHAFNSSSVDLSNDFSVGIEDYVDDILYSGAQNITRGEMIDLIYKIKKSQGEISDNSDLDEEGYPMVLSIITKDDFSINVRYPEYTFWENQDGGEKRKVEEILVNDSVLYFKGLNEYDYEKIESQKDKNSDFDKVLGITNAFIFKTVSDETEMDEFIKNKYGERCEYKGMKSNNVYVDNFLRINRYSVEFGPIDENETIDGRSACFINYGTNTWYYPELQKAVSVDVGQAVLFVIKDSNGEIDYSHSRIIVDSFEMQEPSHMANSHERRIYFDNFLSFEGNEAPKGTPFSAAIDKDGSKIVLMNEVSDMERFKNSKEGLPFYLEEIKSSDVPESCSLAAGPSAEYKSFENICRQVYKTAAAGSSYSEIRYFVNLDNKYYVVSTAFKNFIISGAMDSWTQEQEDKDWEDVASFMNDIDMYVSKISKTIK